MSAFGASFLPIVWGEANLMRTARTAVRDTVHAGFDGDDELAIALTRGWEVVKGHPQAPYGYVVNSMRNGIRDHQRFWARRRCLNGEAVLSYDQAEGDWLDGSTCGEFDDVEARALLEAIRSDLGDETADILRRLADGDEYAEIAAAWGKTLPSVRSAIHRLRIRTQNWMGATS